MSSSCRETRRKEEEKKLYIIELGVREFDFCRSVDDDVHDSLLKFFRIFFFLADIRTKNLAHSVAVAVVTVARSLCVLMEWNGTGELCVSTGSYGFFFSSLTICCVCVRASERARVCMRMAASVYGVCQ